MTQRLKINPRLKLSSETHLPNLGLIPAPTVEIQTVEISGGVSTSSDPTLASVTAPLASVTAPLASVTAQKVLVQPKVHTPTISPTIRQRGLDMFSRKLGKVLCAEELQVLEGATYEAAIDCMSRYSMSDSDSRVANRYNITVQSLCLNLDPESPAKNTYLLPAIREGRVELTRVPTMTPMELNPKDWTKQISNKVAETHQLVEGPTNIVTSALYKCGRCKSGMRCQEVQRRSCDEAMTIEAVCIKCGHRINI
jgi:DNA-directed RNA polymerase subunit M/transcription elongation factor TFIIS